MSAARTKKLINSPETAVTDMLEGLLLAQPALSRLDGFPDVKVIFNQQHDKSKVAVISGGGSGHEPAHAGYVGTGMLAAAVCGDVFASPSAESVLYAIRAVTGAGGCLLVVKNYTGDRLHFGLAAEQAMAEGLRVEMVVVGEDVAIDTPGLAGRRGLAGTVLVHKAAGAAAAAGASLDQVAAVARRVASSMATLGVGLTVCTLPGKAPSERLGAGEVEIGLGIHGEPGHSKAPLEPAGPLVERMLKQMVSGPFFSASSGSRVALLVNNLGATPPMELLVVAREAVRHCKQKLGLAVARLYVGPYMTSLDMAGMSLTLLRLDDTAAEAAAAAPGLPPLSELLDAPVSAPGWHGGLTAADVAGRPAVPIPGLEEDHAGAVAGAQAELSESGTLLGAALRAVCEALAAAAGSLDELDAKVGDGDCGSTLGRGAQAILHGLDAAKYNLNDPAAAALQLAKTIRTSMGGSSGALYDIMLTAAARQLKESGCAPAAWAASLEAGLAAVQKYGNATRKCRTMLDALLPAADVLKEGFNVPGCDVGKVVAAAAAAAEAGAEATRGMAAAAGRASYVPLEVLATVPDPGAKAAAAWMQAVAAALAHSGQQ